MAHETLDARNTDTDTDRHAAAPTQIHQHGQPGRHRHRERERERDLGQQRHPENPAEVEEKDVGVGTCRQVYVALLAYNHICVCCFACRYTEK